MPMSRQKVERAIFHEPSTMTASPRCSESNVLPSTEMENQTAAWVASTKVVRSALILTSAVSGATFAAGFSGRQHLGGDPFSLLHDAEEHVLRADIRVTELERLAQGELEDFLRCRLT